MNEELRNKIYNEYTGNAVIERGYAIYDGWIRTHLSSRTIVSWVERAVSIANAKKTMAAYVEAFAHVCALDLRISERYKSIVRIFLSYFAWRRETRALKKVKIDLNLSGKTDLRSAIEIALQNLREALEESEEDSDDETRGGKSNKVSKEDEERKEKEEADKEKENEEELEDELDEKEKEEKDKDETVKDEQAEDGKDKELDENPLDENIEDKEAGETAPEEKTDEQYIKEKNTENRKESSDFNNEIDDAVKEENNVLIENYRQNVNKSEQSRTYNDAIDLPPLLDDFVSENSEQMENADDDREFTNETDRNNEGAEHDEQQNENELNDDKVNDDKANEKSNENPKTDPKEIENKGDTLKDSQNAPEQNQTGDKMKQSIEPPKEQKSVREQIKVDIDNATENEMRRELNDQLSMSETTILAMKERLEETIREQMQIAFADVDFDAPTGNVGKTEVSQTDPPVVSAPKLK